MGGKPARTDPDSLLGPIAPGDRGAVLAAWSAAMNERGTIVTVAVRVTNGRRWFLQDLRCWNGSYAPAVASVLVILGDAHPLDIAVPADSELAAML